MTNHLPSIARRVYFAYYDDSRADVFPQLLVDLLSIWLGVWVASYAVSRRKCASLFGYHPTAGDVNEFRRDCWGNMLHRLNSTNRATSSKI